MDNKELSINKTFGKYAIYKIKGKRKMFSQYNPLTISEYSNNEFEDAISKLSAHAKNPQKFTIKSENILVYDKETIVSNDYTKKSLRRYLCSNAHFQNCNFINSTAASAQLINCKFDNCVICNSNFQNCEIKNFEMFSNDNKKLNFSNFNNTCIVKFHIHDIILENSIFNGTLFSDGTFQNVVLSSGSFENAIFRNTIFDNVAFNDLNIDYSEFDCIKMKNTTLPFSQIPYAFGLLEYLINTKDDVYITSACNKRITVQEYLSLLNYFEIYYAKTEAFFPLANIYICTGRSALAYTAIENGMKKALFDHNYHLLKYFCKLISKYSYFTYNQCQNLYYKINEFAIITNTSFMDQYRFYLQKPLMEYYLLRNADSDNAVLELLIQTDYNYSEISKTNFIYEYLELITSNLESESGSHKIEVSHHSAPGITLIFEDMLCYLLVAVPIIYAGLKGFLGLLNTYQDYLSKHEDYIKNKKLHKSIIEGTILDNEQKRLDIEKTKLEILDLLRKQEIEEKTANLKSKAETTYEYIQQNNIQIREIKHNIFYMHGDIGNSDLQHFSYDK